MLGKFFFNKYAICKVDVLLTLQFSFDRQNGKKCHNFIFFYFYFFIYIYFLFLILVFMEHRLQVRLLCYNDNPKTLEYGDDF